MAGALVRWSSCSQEMRFHKLILQEPQSLSKSRDLCPPASLEQTVTVSFKGFLLEFKYDWNFFINKIILAVDGITICKRHCLCFLKEMWFGDGPNFLVFDLWWCVNADSNESGLNLPMLKWLMLMFKVDDCCWSPHSVHIWRRRFDLIRQMTCLRLRCILSLGRTWIWYLRCLYMNYDL